MKKQVVDVTLTSHRAYVTDCSDEVHGKLRDFWSFFAPAAPYDRRYKLWLREQYEAKKEDRKPDPKMGWDGKIRLFQKGSLPAGLFRATAEDAALSLGLKFNVEYDLAKSPKLRLGIQGTAEKYKFQVECVDAMTAAIRDGGGIVLSATGTGKTREAAMFFSRVACPCLFVVDQIDLLYQQQKELATWLGESVGVVGDQEYEVQRVTVATRQTLNYHISDPVFLKWYKAVQIVFVDELHQQMGKTNFDVLEKIQPIARFGLTATLQLTKKPVRFKAFSFAGPVLYQFPLSEGVERKVLSKGKALQILFPPEVDFDVHDYVEEYDYEVIESEVKKTATQLIVEYLLKIGRYAIVLAVRQRHIEELSELFEEIPHRIAYGKVGKKKRRVARAKFEKGKIKLLIASDVFKKGINMKRVDAIIDRAEMNNPDDVQQKYGRGVRLHPDKENLLYIDIGTQGKGRFGKRARRRRRALLALKLEVKTVKVNTAREALLAVKRFMAKEMGCQLKLPLVG